MRGCWNQWPHFWWGNFGSVSIKRCLWNNELDIPAPLPDRKNKVPYVCTGDDAFPLLTYMMKLFLLINLTKERRVFSYWLCKKIRISKNGFGTLANLWRISRQPFALVAEKVKMITLAVIALHNWLRSESSFEEILYSLWPSRLQKYRYQWNFWGILEIWTHYLHLVSSFKLFLHKAFN